MLIKTTAATALLPADSVVYGCFLSLSLVSQPETFEMQELCNELEDLKLQHRKTHTATDRTELQPIALVPSLLTCSLRMLLLFSLPVLPPAERKLQLSAIESKHRVAMESELTTPLQQRRQIKQEAMKQIQEKKEKLLAKSKQMMQVDSMQTGALLQPSATFPVC